VYVEGRMQTRQWQDQEGQTRYLSEVIANDIIILDGRRDGSSTPLADPPAETQLESPSPSPARRSAAPDQPASARQRPGSIGAPARAAKVASLPRGKDAFEEEDLPF
jgi:single-strand DNA-binding protein